MLSERRACRQWSSGTRWSEPLAPIRRAQSVEYAEHIASRWQQVTRRLAEAYAATFPQRPSQRGLFAQQGAWRALTQNRAEARARHARVFKDAGLVAIPLQCAEANLTAAYARAVCEEAYSRQN